MDDGIGFDASDDPLKRTVGWLPNWPLHFCKAIWNAGLLDADFDGAGFNWLRNSGGPIN